MMWAVLQHEGRSLLSGVDCAKAESRRREGELYLNHEVDRGLYGILRQLFLSLSLGMLFPQQIAFRSPARPGIAEAA